jgi:hypothetical protein
MKNFILAFLVAFATIGNAQTKLISHKSHSGSNATFALAVENELFDIAESDFGEAPIQIVKNSSLDTVIYVSKTKSIMITSEHCKKINVYNNNELLESKIWKAGKDTVHSHPLFTQKHSLDSIKNVLKSQYNFQNNIDKTVFIGFDNKPEKTKKKKSFAPFTTSNKPNFPNYLLTIGVLSLLSVLVYYLSLKIKSRKMILAN